MKWNSVCTLILILIFSGEAQGEALSELGLFYRCHAHLTNKRPARDNPLLIQVQRKVISAEDACVKILEAGLLGSDNKVSKNRISKDVFQTMTKAHMNFFETKVFQSVDGRSEALAYDVYDIQSSALYYSKALFKKEDITNILKDKNSYVGVRSEGSPKDKSYVGNVSKTVFKARSSDNQKDIDFTPKNFTESGELLGIKKYDFPMPGIYHEGGDNLNISHGGGVLGSKAYEMAVLKPNLSIPDGANTMNRSPANTVLSDFLCKSLPAVRIADGKPYKDKGATSEFRKSDGCVRCHATMDQLAAGLRGLRLITSSRDLSSRFVYTYKLKVDESKKPKNVRSVWPIKADSNYGRYKPNGVLYFRSYTGELVKEPFSNLDSLGATLLKTDDFYACIAKKYYEYFTGVPVSLADIQDPASPINLGPEELGRREEVIKLGEELKKTKSTFKLVESILRSPTYRDEAYSN